MTGAGDDPDPARADRNLIAMGETAIGCRKRYGPFEIVLAAAEQLLGDRLVHAVASKELPRIDNPLFGSAVLLIDPPQLLHLPHIKTATEPFDDPPRPPP